MTLICLFSLMALKQPDEKTSMNRRKLLKDPDSFFTMHVNYVHLPAFATGREEYVNSLLIPATKSLNKLQFRKLSTAPRAGW